MPAAQCPECGRFLSKEFVASLAVEPVPCPKCATELTAAHFPERLGQAASPEGPDEEPAAAAALREEQPDVPAADDSVRPPDLAPDEVRVDDTGQPDPLAGWDQGPAATQHHVAQSPPDLAILAGAAAAGAVAGAVTARSHRASGASLGAVVGLLVAAVARQVWRLPDEA